MGLTCHAFFDPAMSTLWRSLPSPNELITVLPEHTRGADHDTYLTVVKEPSEADWLRFESYSRRVRYLDYLLSVEDDDDGSLIPAPRIDWDSVLKYYPPQKLFPNLLRFNSSSSFGEHWPLFIKPSLRFLSIDIDENEEALVARCLVECATTLKTCSIISRREDTSSTYDISYAVSSFRSLTQLDVSSLSLLPQALEALSHLPSLNDLVFGLDIVDNSREQLPFLSLQLLTVTMRTSNLMVAAFLRRITAPRLIVLKIYYAAAENPMPVGGALSPRHRPTAVYVDALLAAASTFSTLQLFMLHPRPASVGPEHALAPQEICTASVLRPLLDLHELRVVHMPAIPIILMPSDIAAFASAWPNVYALVISSDVQHIWSSVQVHDLLPLAQRCAELGSLALPLAITANGGQVPEAPPFGGSVAPLHSLYIGSANVEFSPEAAAYLACMFPDAELHTHGEPSPAFELLKRTKRTVVETMRRQFAYEKQSHGDEQ
ncbi:hypothetical protein PsYK624_136770 [Phanerochaete sordida]|uniref:F-box domain-containing protein n=1 Tax=Phanerochaete sordida TaxID=48140 RepID=A0A9P3GKA2_9APHY|nr:hypothetical protein PsYK624_136770 [Phanerochaete sordida]